MTDAAQQQEQVNVRSLSLEQIRDHLLAAEARKAEINAAVGMLQEELTFRLGAEATRLFEASKKQSGDITFAAHGGLKFKASISKTVKWDDAKLQAIAAELDWPTAQRIFDIKFSVPERTFNAITDDALLSKLEAARTTKLGDLKIIPIS